MCGGGAFSVAMLERRQMEGGGKRERGDRVREGGAKRERERER